MNDTNLIVFAVGFWVVLMLSIGLFITTNSFRDINQHPENYTRNRFLTEAPVKKSTGI